MTLRKLLTTSLAATSLAFLCACGSAHIKPFKSKEQVNSLSYDEKLIWHQSKEFEERVVKGKHIYENEELETYLQSIMDKLFPDYKGNLRVKVFNSPSYNAFALPNGAIYINLGLLAAFENEAQVASVLGHEGAHFIEKHGAIRYSSAQSASVFNMVLAVTIPMAAILTAVATTSSMYGYSRKAETESDNIGFERLVKAGYSPEQAAEAMRKLLKEVEDSGVEEPFFFASHPKLKERIENFEVLSAELENKPTFLGEQEYRKFTKEILLDSAQLQIDFGRFNSVVSLLSDEQRLKRYGGEGHYFIAEAKRKQDKVDNDEVIQHYEKAIELSPQFYAAHRSLGLLHYKNGNNEKAKFHLSEYIDNNKTAKDKAHVQFYLNKLK